MSTPAPSLDFSSFADAYESLLVGPIFRPWAELIVERLDLSPGRSVLDVACGTGIVARLAKARLGSADRVVGVDVNPAMLAVASRVAPDIDWREGPASALPVEPGDRFDIVTCHQGLQFFPDKPLAARELRRVLAPGGRLIVATWRPVDEHPFLVELQRIVERHVGPATDTRHAFGDDRAIHALLTDAGFIDVEVEVHALPSHFAEWSTFVRMNAMALVGMSARSKELTQDERNSIIASVIRESEDVVRPYLHGNALTFELRSNIATARG